MRCRGSIRGLRGDEPEQEQEDEQFPATVTFLGLSCSATNVTHMHAPLGHTGEDCQGSKVIYGLNFMIGAQEEQLASVRSAILSHAR